MDEEHKGCDLIVTIVKKGCSELIIQASIKAGAKGWNCNFRKRYWNTRTTKNTWNSNRARKRGKY